jgi:hypothetical protein
MPGPTAIARARSEPWTLIGYFAQRR